MKQTGQFVIEASGRKYYFATLEAAKWAAQDLWQRRGIIAGIVAA